MHALLQSITAFFAATAHTYLSLSPWELFLALWPFLLIEMPRYVLSEFIVLCLSFRREPPEKTQFRAALSTAPPLVSVLLPGYNEAETLETTVIALREQTYPNMEIIVVSDGSTDGMDAVGRRLAARGWIRYFEHHIRGGKSSAANFALNAARGDYIVICDADSTFDTESIWHLMVEFYRPEVTAVAGNLRARNAAVNLLTRCQAMQYLMSIGVGRRVSEWLGILFIVSGAFGAFKRDVLLGSGGWDTGPGEDADLTTKVRVAGGEVAFAPAAMCMTDVPDKWYAYFRQQMRWNRSTVRFRLRRYRWLLSPRGRNFRWSNLLGMLDIILFQIIFTFIFPFYIVWLYFTYPDLFGYLLAGIVILYIAVNYIHFAVALAFSERKRLDLGLLPYIPLYGLFMGWWLRIVRLISYLDEWIFRSSFKEPYVPEYVQSQSREFE
ncbi:MAG: glycosyltransferase family 2 protein [Sinobacteraceae bacterium]|nr:glycosyltransferase family 2 protein [Nevskiaceae bacterium]